MSVCSTFLPLLLCARKESNYAQKLPMRHKSMAMSSYSNELSKTFPSQGALGCSCDGCGKNLLDAMLSGVKDCSLHLDTSQVRIHTSSKSDIYLRVRSYPVIEQCTQIRFAPFREDNAEGQAPEKSGLWSQVQDFSWLKPEPSPHW